MRADRERGEALVLYVVDADASIRQAMCRLAGASGFRARAFASIEQFMTELEPTDNGCLLLDSSLVRAGSAHRDVVQRRAPAWPMIMLCVGADEAARHGAMDFGADFLLNKPVDAQALFDAIAWVAMRRMDL